MSLVDEYRASLEVENLVFMNLKRLCNKVQTKYSRRKRFLLNRFEEEFKLVGTSAKMIKLSSDRIRFFVLVLHLFWKFAREEVSSDNSKPCNDEKASELYDLFKEASFVKMVDLCRGSLADIDLEDPELVAIERNFHIQTKKYAEEFNRIRSTEEEELEGEEDEEEEGHLLPSNSEMQMIPIITKRIIELIGRTKFESVKKTSPNEIINSGHNQKYLNNEKLSGDPMEVLDMLSDSFTNLSTHLRKEKQKNKEVYQVINRIREKYIKNSDDGKENEKVTCCDHINKSNDRYEECLIFEKVKNVRTKVVRMNLESLQKFNTPLTKKKNSRNLTESEKLRRAKDIPSPPGYNYGIELDFSEIIDDDNREETCEEESIDDDNREETCEEESEGEEESKEEVESSSDDESEESHDEESEGEVDCEENEEVYSDSESEKSEEDEFARHGRSSKMLRETLEVEKMINVLLKGVKSRLKRTSCELKMKEREKEAHKKELQNQKKINESLSEKYTCLQDDYERSNQSMERITKEKREVETKLKDYTDIVKNVMNEKSIMEKEKKLHDTQMKESNEKFVCEVKKHKKICDMLKMTKKELKSEKKKNEELIHRRCDLYKKLDVVKGKLDFEIQKKEVRKETWKELKEQLEQDVAQKDLELAKMKEVVTKKKTDYENVVKCAWKWKVIAVGLSFVVIVVFVLLFFF